MKEIKMVISENDYNRLIRIATLDAVECGNEVLYKTERDKIRYGIDCAIRSFIDSSEIYWGEYNEEDY